MKRIDLRSDTVTRPSPAMREAMAAAEVGDDVYGEDPTVNRLQELVAETLGKEDALFVPSGTQGNLLGVMSHCERGDEYIVGQLAHTYKWEGGGAAVLGSIQPQPIDSEPDGTLDLDKVEKVIKLAGDPHFARTRLLCLENTHLGKVLPLDYLQRAHDFARRKGLRLHLDGARLFNAVVAQGVPASDIAGLFDTVSVCLSKGLGAPVGSVLCGSHDLIEKARRWRKVLGGGMRQAGILAAAGIYALENNVERLAEDHENAQLLGDRLRAIEAEGLTVGPEAVHTNMVLIQVERARIEPLRRSLEQRDMRILTRYVGGNEIRLVTHLDVRRDDVLAFADAVAGFFTG
jgi:threonine aldolase